MDFISTYGLFLAKTATIIIAIIILIAAILAIAAKGKEKAKSKLNVKKLNDKYDEAANTIKEAVLSKNELKQEAKEKKKRKKASNKNQSKQRVFVLNFVGDIKASAVEQLKEEITALLTVVTPKDEVVVRLESPGGIVHGYGLAASQLKRLRDRGIPLTVAVDKVAASGGYLMACVADRIIAAPFAIIGSIGVIAQLPNFHKYLKNKNIEFEQIMAGEYKRTLTLFGENTDKGRKKMQEDVDNIQQLFTTFIKENRSWVDIEKVATGEHWHANKALTLQLVDELMTSDDYLLNASKSADIYEIKLKTKKGIMQKMASSIQYCIDKTLLHFIHKQQTIC